jgi:WD40 repeat protein/Flp pilus assembly protein TadD
MMTCPSTETLQQLIDDTLSADDHRALDAHLETCAVCKALLDRLAGRATVGSVYVPGPGHHHAAEPSTIPFVDFAAPMPRVPGFDVLGELGRGGMGVVYKARQVELKRIVALKMILAGAHAGAGALRRFQTEAEAVARLQHPNIVQIYEIGRHEDLPFFALEFVEGGNLHQKLARTPQPANEAAGLIETLARAIHVAHQRGIVHRDLKPANILLTSDGQPKISDFGLAKQLDEDSGQTHTGQVMGTPSYMSPEQAAGRIQEIGPLTDVYALGAILYEMLTGRPPFKGANARETLDQVCFQEPVAPTLFQPKLPRDIDTICLKCLRKEPSQRYASAQALAEDLRRFLAGEPILARPVSAWQRALKWARRRPALAGLFLTAAGLLFVATIAAFALVGYLTRLQYSWQLEDSNALLDAARDRAEKSKKEAEDNRAEAVKQKAEAERQRMEADKLRLLAHRYQYAAQINLAHRSWHEKAMPEMLDLLYGMLPEQSDDQDPRGFEWYYLKRLCRSELFTLEGFKGPVITMAFSPDGQRLATADRNVLKVWDLKTRHQVVTIQGSYHNPVFSQDGNRLAAGTGSDSKQFAIKVWDSANGQELLTIDTGPWIEVFGADGQIFTRDSERVKAWDLMTGENTQSSPRKLSAQAALVFSSNAKHFAEVVHVDKPANIRRLVVSAMAKVKNPWSVELVSDNVAFSPDGKLLAFSAGISAYFRANQNDVQLRDLQGGPKTHAPLKGHTAPVKILAFSPDSRQVASASSDGILKVWQLASGKELLTYQTGAAASSLVFSPNGKALAATIGNTVKVYDATVGRESLTFPSLITLQSYHGNVLFSPDGKRLACLRASTQPLQGFSVAIWDSTIAKELARISLGKGAGGTPLKMGFSPSGERFATIVQGTVKVWEISTPAKATFTFSTGNRDLAAAEFSPDGQRLATAAKVPADQESTEVKVWDWVSGKEIFSVPGPAGSVTALAFNQDCQRLVAVGTKSVKVFDATTGKELQSFDLVTGGPTSSAAISPDGHRVVLASANEIRLLDATTGTQLLSFRPARDGGVAFSADAQRLVCGGLNNTVRVYDVATGQELLALKGHLSPIRHVAFSLDGKRVAAASYGITDEPPSILTIWDGSPLEEETERANGAQAHIYLGKALYSKQNFEGAIMKYRLAIQLQPNNALAHTGLANALYGKKDLQGAISVYRKAVEIDPDDPLAYINLANALRDNKDLENAATLYRKAAGLYAERGWAYYQSDQRTKAMADLRQRAIADLSKAIEFDAKCFLTYLRRGIVYNSKGSWHNAIADLSQAIQIDPKYPSCYMNRAWAYNKLNKRDEAMADYSKAFQIGPIFIVPY